MQAIGDDEDGAEEPNKKDVWWHKQSFALLADGKWTC